MSKDKRPGVSGIPDKYDMSAEELIGLRTEIESGFGASAVRDEIMRALYKAYKLGDMSAALSPRRETSNGTKRNTKGRSRSGFKG